MASLITVAAAGALLRVRPWVVNRQGRRLYVDPSDRRAWRLAAHRGALDAPAVNVWRMLAERHRPDLVIDVGANYGEVTLAAEYPGAAVHLVEANPVVAARLRKSVDRAGLGTVHEVAASDHTGEATLTLDRRSSGLSTLEARTGSSTVSVPTVKLDDLVNGGRRLLFKMDVEGHEPAVLRGMERILARTEWIGLVENNADVKAPHIYAVRRDGLRLQEVGNAAEAAGRPELTKDIVISSAPLT